MGIEFRPLHGHPVGPADAQVDLRGGAGEAVGPPPLLELLGVGEGVKDTLRRGFERALDDELLGGGRGADDPRRCGSQALGFSPGVGGFRLGGKMGVETVEAVGPFEMSAAEPVVHGNQALELKTRRAALTVAAPADEPGALQHLEVLGDGGLRERGGVGQLDDAGLACPRRSRMARRVGSASAAKARLRGSSIDITVR